MPGISSTFGATDSVHASATCAGVRPSLDASRCTAGWPSTGLSDVKAEPSGKNGTNAMPCSMHASSTGCDVRSDEVVRVLHAHDLGAVQRDLQMLGRDAAQPIPPISPSSRALIIAVSWRSNSSRSTAAGLLGSAVSSCTRRFTAASRSVPSVLRFSSMAGAQFVGLLRGQPRAGVVAPGADLAHEREVSRIRVKRLADELVGDVGSVELRGVDVVDAQFDCAAQHGERLVVVARRPEHARPG